MDFAYLKGSKQGHVVTVSTATEMFATVKSSSILRSMGRKNEGVMICQCTGNGENWVQTLKYHSTQHHLAQMGFNR